MKRNTHPEFVGLEKLKEKQKWQLGLFQAWAANRQWREIHAAHYDWWMFPIDQESSYGFAWTVYEGDVRELKADGQYMRNYLQGVELLATAWGWDLAAQTYIINPHPDQCWQHWPVRLYKCATSLKLFGFAAQFASLKQYAHELMRQGADMTYGGRDLGRLFR
ncbi:MAG: hypothetical protein JOZ96_24275 [Acidobacteria bacterium]|nr:hypothetical protein [Acidobacteriota bacterium]